MQVWLGLPHATSSGCPRAAGLRRRAACQASGAQDGGGKGARARAPKRQFVVCVLRVAPRVAPHDTRHVTYGETEKQGPRAPRRNRYSPPSGPSYSVFARFRRGRIALGRHLPSLSAALAFASRVAAERFHDPDAVFIVDDHTGFEVPGAARSARGGVWSVQISLERDQRLLDAQARSREHLTVLGTRLADLESTLARIRERRAVHRRIAAIPLPASISQPMHERVLRCMRDAAAAQERHLQLWASLEQSAVQLRRSYDIFLGHAPWSQKLAG